VATKYGTVEAVVVAAAVAVVVVAALGGVHETEARPPLFVRFCVPLASYVNVPTDDGL